MVLSLSSTCWTSTFHHLFHVNCLWDYMYVTLLTRNVIQCECVLISFSSYSPDSCLSWHSPLTITADVRRYLLPWIGFNKIQVMFVWIGVSLSLKRTGSVRLTWPVLLWTMNDLDWRLDENGVQTMSYLLFLLKHSMRSSEDLFF